MTLRNLTGHCCPCSGFCHHVGPVQLCDNHKPPTLGESTPARIYATGYHDGATYALWLRDLMAAANYPYDPNQPLHQQVRACDQLIRDTRAIHDELSTRLTIDSDRHEAEVQRLTDLTDELRKQLAGADRHTVQLQEQLTQQRTENTKLHQLIQGRDAELHEVRTDLEDAQARTGNLDRLLQERDSLIEAACPCLPDAPKHEHLTGGYAPDWAELRRAVRGVTEPDGTPEPPPGPLKPLGTPNIAAGIDQYWQDDNQP